MPLVSVDPGPQTRHTRVFVAFLLVLALAVAGVAHADRSEREAERSEAIRIPDGTDYGAGLQLASVSSLEEVASHPDRFAA